MFGQRRETRYTVYQRTQREAVKRGSSVADSQAEAQAAAREWEEARAARLAEKKERKAATSKTCQICGRPIFAEIGVIAHHGYQRPGWGVQTASCWGARELPFETDRAVLGKYMVLLRKEELEKVLVIEALETDTISAWKSWTEYDYKNMAGQKPRKRRTWFTRETFAEVQAAEPKAFEGHYPYPGEGFDYFKGRLLEAKRQDLSMFRDYIRDQQKRFDTWTKTQEWDGETWKLIPGSTRGKKRLQNGEPT